MELVIIRHLQVLLLGKIGSHPFGNVSFHFIGLFLAMLRVRGEIECNSADPAPVRLCGNETLHHLSGLLKRRLSRGKSTFFHLRKPKLCQNGNTCISEAWGFGIRIHWRGNSDQREHADIRRPQNRPQSAHERTIS